ncbi:MAG: hypothetical protein C4521_04190 [Actinobacteria bacterium]|nr:MAG: hypothetical protein C4521_04190 [Actinomycetota bacterium]
MKDRITGTVEQVELFSPSPIWLIHYRSGNVCGVVSTDSDTVAAAARRLLGSKAAFWMNGRGVSRRVVRVARAFSRGNPKGVSSLMTLLEAK